MSFIAGFSNRLTCLGIFRRPLPLQTGLGVSPNEVSRNKTARDRLFRRWRQAMNIARVLSVEELSLFL
jgi:hypothetical protein